MISSKFTHWKSRFSVLMFRFLFCPVFTWVLTFSPSLADDTPIKQERKLQLPIPKGNSPAIKDLAEIVNTANATIRETKQEELGKVLAATAKSLVACARKHPGDQGALELLINAISMSMQSSEGALTRDEAIDLVRLILMNTTIEKTPEIRMHMRFLASGISDSGTELVRDVFKHHTDRLTRAHAAQELIKAMSTRLGLIKMMATNNEIRMNSEKNMGNDKVQKLLDSMPQIAKEIDNYRVALRTELKGQLPDLNIGGHAPETIGLNLDGKMVRLSDLRGKVVVLDFWTTSCVPCRKLIPHARELVKTMNGRPFVFVNISLDDDKETLKEFLRKEPMPWMHWWDPKKTLAEQWELRVLGTLYIIDHKGIIQYKSEEGYDPTSDKLEKKVEELVKLAEGKQ